jgi:hypothetical protein
MAFIVIDLKKKECLHTSSEIKLGFIVTQTAYTGMVTVCYSKSVPTCVHICRFSLTGKFSDIVQLNMN